jgi:hypothetical protein
VSGTLFQPVNLEHESDYLREVWCVDLGLPAKSVDGRYAGYQQFAAAARVLLRPIPPAQDGSQVIDRDRVNPTCFLAPARHRARVEGRPPGQAA